MLAESRKSTARVRLRRQSPGERAAQSRGGVVMKTQPIRSPLARVRAAELGRDGGPTDAQLLGRFVEEHDEAALAALVRRLGPAVLGVCRRVVGDEHLAEDAFQATFLVLVRKAEQIRPREQVGSWLFGVAYRVARRARAVRYRRLAKEQSMPAPEDRAASRSQSEASLEDHAASRSRPEDDV